MASVRSGRLSVIEAFPEELDALIQANWSNDPGEISSRLRALTELSLRVDTLGLQIVAERVAHFAVRGWQRPA